VRFILQMALRETRAAWKRLLFFFACLALGVAAIVTLRSVIESVRVVMTGEARTLIGGDILITTSRPWVESDRAALDARLAAQPGVRTRTEAIETATMARPADERKPLARMVEIRGVETSFPLYGEVRLRNGQRYSHSLLEQHGVLVRPELLTVLDVAVGDSLIIGRTTFVIRGVLDSEPGRRSGGFSLGPRVLVDRQALADAGLLGYGSRANYQVMLRVDESKVAALGKSLTDAFKDRFINVRTFRSTETDLGEDLARAENYLSLVGLVILVLGGIGVSSVTRVFVDQKLKSIAILKCVGAATRHVLGIYMTEIVALGLAGSLMGVALAAVIVGALPAFVPTTGPTGAPIDYTLTRSAMAQGVLVGLLVAVLFALVPLLRVRRVRPSLLLREESGGSGGIDWVRVLALALVGIALVAVAGWQAGSLRVGLVVCGGFLAITLVLLAAAWVLVWLVKPLRRAKSFVVRHAALNLDRPGNQTRTVLLAVGLGCFFIVGVRAIETNLLESLNINLTADAPDMFLIDIQQDQAAPLAAFLTPRIAPAPAPLLLPVLRARVTGVRGKQISLDTLAEVRERGSLAREYTITYRSALQRNERVIEGRFWDTTPSATPEVSIEQGLRDRFHIQVGDTVRFDVLGRPIEAKVTSVRAIEWRDARAGGFMFVFRPGSLEKAPHGFIAPFRAPDDVAQRSRLQRDLVAAFPNVSVIDLREFLDTGRALIRSLTLGVTIVGGLVLFTGVLILIGAVAMTRFRRTREAAILKTVGASTRVIGKLLLLEYGMLGFIAGTVGAAGGLVLSWAISRWAIDLAWTAPWLDALAALACTIALVSGVGLAASIDVLRRRPLATLRAE
jgi:putative ABC transport system permease protein